MTLRNYRHVRKRYQTSQRQPETTYPKSPNSPRGVKCILDGETSCVNCDHERELSPVQSARPPKPPDTTSDSQLPICDPTPSGCFPSTLALLRWRPQTDIRPRPRKNHSSRIAEHIGCQNQGGKHYRWSRRSASERVTSRPCSDQSIMRAGTRRIEGVAIKEKPIATNLS